MPPAPRVALAQARVDKAEVDLGRTVIRSPVDGIIARRQVQLGERVQPSTPLLSVVPVSEMYVNANFKEVQLKKVRAGQQVELVADLYGHKVVYHGVIAGFNGGTGSAFALIPAQNATGNWIKVVQRLPVRIALDPEELDRASAAGRAVGGRQGRSAQPSVRLKRPRTAPIQKHDSSRRQTMSAVANDHSEQPALQGLMLWVGGDRSRPRQLRRRTRT